MGPYRIITVCVKKNSSKCFFSNPVHFKNTLIFKLCTDQTHGRFNLGSIFTTSLQLHSTWKAQQSEKSASQHYEGQSWGLWTDARLREHVLKECKTDYRLQGLSFYVCGCLCVWERQEKRRKSHVCMCTNTGYINARKIRKGSTEPNVVI